MWYNYWAIFFRYKNDRDVFNKSFSIRNNVFIIIVKDFQKKKKKNLLY